MRKGFTLLELLIVIIIVGILAAISTPMIAKNLRKARVTEAIAALGAIRTQMRYLYSVTGRYDKRLDGTDMGTWPDDSGHVIGNVPGFMPGDLDGTWFQDDDYYIKTVTTTTFVSNVWVYDNDRPEINGFEASIDQEGTITDNLNY